MGARDGQTVRYLSDQSGVFEVHGGALRQMVPEPPIAWQSSGPPVSILGAKGRDIGAATFQGRARKSVLVVTSALQRSNRACRGMREWTDMTIEVDATEGACVGARSNQLATCGLFFCASRSEWNLTRGGPERGGSIASGPLRFAGTWRTLNLSVSHAGTHAEVEASVDAALVLDARVPNADTGFAAVATTRFAPVAFRSIRVDLLPVAPLPRCGAAGAGVVQKTGHRNATRILSRDSTPFGSSCGRSVAPTRSVVATVASRSPHLGALLPALRAQRAARGGPGLRARRGVAAPARRPLRRGAAGRRRARPVRRRRALAGQNGGRGRRTAERSRGGPAQGRGVLSFQKCLS